jgi:hypothetical protein
MTHGLAFAQQCLDGRLDLDERREIFAKCCGTERLRLTDFAVSVDLYGSVTERRGE